MFLGNLGHPKTYPNSSSSPFYGHFGKFSFSQFVTFGPYICTAKSTGFLGTIHWTAFGPDGYFCDTFWPRPSLLGYLRRLKKILVKTLITTLFEQFWNLVGKGSPRPPTGPRGARGPKKTCRGHSSGYISRAYTVFIHFK